MESSEWQTQLTMPALLRHARQTYGRAMRAALASAGFDDVPANGLYIIGGLAIERDIPLRELVRQLGISKQGAGQLVDALVLRGYLSRTADPNDRRQLIVSLTDRGRAVAEVQSAARERIDQALSRRMGKGELEAARNVLAVLIDLDGAAPESSGSPSEERSKANG